ncbi:hypothetical protein GU926_16215 [Nibribacter ruber]|uniref:STAS/SEC14 domain-containing protein n=1 Tax=Nibribacter ruber TaxID=2698458 RepID=A0A6P1P3B1_9BACT|nr:hypothetical protein [Nibribacter ruber]QHL88889.1 hypothetical protein GU926_16215 [Nibribacter ruber]
MIIFQNGLLTLDYEPSTDILFVEWPDIQAFVMPEIKQALQILVDHIKNYDIKRLLIDASKTNLEVQTEEYTVLLKEFGTNLMTTRLEKLARIQTGSGSRENSVQQARKETQFTVRLENFTNKEEALDWLKQKKEPLFT